MIVTVKDIDTFRNDVRITAPNIANRCVGLFGQLIYVCERNDSDTVRRFVRLRGIRPHLTGGIRIVCTCKFRHTVHCHIARSLQQIFCYHLRSTRVRIMTAARFINMRKPKRMMIAADVLSANARSGLSAHRYT